jgi:hypothetical protein
MAFSTMRPPTKPTGHTDTFLVALITSKSSISAKKVHNIVREDHIVQPVKELMQERGELIKLIRDKC